MLPPIFSWFPAGDETVLWLSVGAWCCKPPGVCYVMTDTDKSITIINVNTVTVVGPDHSRIKMQTIPISDILYLNPCHVRIVRCKPHIVLYFKADHYWWTLERNHPSHQPKRFLQQRSYPQIATEYSPVSPSLTVYHHNVISAHFSSGTSQILTDIILVLIFKQKLEHVEDWSSLWLLSCFQIDRSADGRGSTKK